MLKKPTQPTKTQNNKTFNKSKKKQNNRQKAKNDQKNNNKIFPAWDVFQTKSTYAHFKGLSSEKEAPSHLDLVVNECQQNK